MEVIEEEEEEEENDDDDDDDDEELGRIESEDVKYSGGIIGSCSLQLDHASASFSCLASF